MKVILKKTPLYESFDFDSYEDENFDDIIESHRYKKFLEDNYDIKGIIRHYKKDGVFFIDIDGSVTVKNENLTSLTNGQFCFGKVEGDFYCDDCAFLKSLKGAPEEVGGDFSCSYCNSLTSLEGAPNIVNGSFGCYNCSSLKSLEGAPKEVGGSFYCNGCKSLTSLKGTPEEVGGNFYCYGCKSLKTIDLPLTSKINGKLIR